MLTTYPLLDGKIQQLCFAIFPRVWEFRSPANYFPNCERGAFRQKTNRAHANYSDTVLHDNYSLQTINTRPIKKYIQKYPKRKHASKLPQHNLNITSKLPSKYLKRKITSKLP